MQHHGAPTRLLDWTDGALLGLYFALRNHPNINRGKCQHEINDAAVWVLDPAWLNRKSIPDSYTEGVLLYNWPEIEPWFPEPFSETLHVKNPVAIDPPHVARRVAVQHSRFTVHGTDENGIETIADANPKDNRLVKIPVVKDKVQDIFEDLAACGIVETTIFPDLEGLARQLTREWSEHP
jgi:FRG domain